MISRALFLGGLLLITQVGLVRADAIPSAPDCPAGARGVTSHAGQWCEVADCSEPCAAGESCRDWRICTSAMTIPAGRTYGGTYGPIEEDEVVATCAPSGTCDGSTPWPPTVGTRHGEVSCRIARVCVSDSAPTSAPPASVATPPTSSPPTSAPPTSTSAEPSSSMCSITRVGRGGAMLSTLGIALVLWAVRRRERIANRS